MCASCRIPCFPPHRRHSVASVDIFRVKIINVCTSAPQPYAPPSLGVLSSAARKDLHVRKSEADICPIIRRKYVVTVTKYVAISLFNDDILWPDYCSG